MENLGKLRNMASIYLSCDDKILLLFRQGSRVVNDLQLRYITIRRTKGEIRLNYYFFAELKGGMEMNLKSDEGTLKWFETEELKELQMPFSAKYVIEHYLREGRNNNMIYGGIGDGEKVVFTELPEF